MNDEENLYDAELTSLQDEFEEEQKQIVEKHEKEMANLMDVVYAMEQGFEEADSTYKHYRSP